MNTKKGTKKAKKLTKKEREELLKLLAENSKGLEAKLEAIDETKKVPIKIFYEKY